MLRTTIRIYCWIDRMKDHELNQILDENLPRLGGAGGEEAFHALIELPLFAVPVLIKRYHATEDTRLRGQIVNVIWELRDPQSLDFLFDVLVKATEREVWDQALSGIVTIGREPEMDRLIELKNEMEDEDKIARTIEAIEFIGHLISDPKREFIVYNGVRMPKGWDKKIEEAQALTTFTVGDERLPRIKFGDEQVQWPTDQPCDICGVKKGQYHVPGCNHEECPNCGNEVMVCRCADEVLKEE